MKGGLQGAGILRSTGKPSILEIAAVVMATSFYNIESSSIHKISLS